MTIQPLAGPATPPISLGAGLRHLARPWTARLVVAGLVVLAASVAELAPPLIVRHVIDANLLPDRTTGLALAGLDRSSSEVACGVGCPRVATCR